MSEMTDKIRQRLHAVKDFRGPAKYKREELLAELGECIWDHEDKIMLALDALELKYGPAYDELAAYCNSFRQCKEVPKSLMYEVLQFADAMLTMRNYATVFLQWCYSEFREQIEHRSLDRGDEEGDGTARHLLEFMEEFVNDSPGNKTSAG